jgi:hypothetical protein
MYHKQVPSFRVGEDGELEEIFGWIQWDDDVAWTSVDGGEVQDLDVRKSVRGRLNGEGVFVLVADSREQANAWDPRSIKCKGVQVLASTGLRERDGFAFSDPDTHGEVLVCAMHPSREFGTIELDDLRYNRFSLRRRENELTVVDCLEVTVERKIAFYTVDHQNVLPYVDVWARFGKKCEIDSAGNEVRMDMFLRNPDLRALPERMFAFMNWNGPLDVDTYYAKGVDIVAHSSDPSQMNRWNEESYPGYLVVSADDLEGGAMTIEDFGGHRILLAPRKIDDRVRVQGSVAQIDQSERSRAVRLTVFDPKTSAKRRIVASLALGPKPRVFVRSGGSTPYREICRDQVSGNRSPCIQGLQLPADSERRFDLDTIESSPGVRLLGVAEGEKSIFFKGIGWLCIDLDDGNSVMVDLKDGNILSDVAIV